MVWLTVLFHRFLEGSKHTRCLQSSVTEAGTLQALRVLGSYFAYKVNKLERSYAY